LLIIVKYLVKSVFVCVFVCVCGCENMTLEFNLPINFILYPQLFYSDPEPPIINQSHPCNKHQNRWIRIR